MGWILLLIFLDGLVDLDDIGLIRCVNVFLRIPLRIPLYIYTEYMKYM